MQKSTKSLFYFPIMKILSFTVVYMKLICMDTSEVPRPGPAQEYR